MILISSSFNSKASLFNNVHNTNFRLKYSGTAFYLWLGLQLHDFNFKCQSIDSAQFVILHKIPKFYESLDASMNDN